MFQPLVGTGDQPHPVGIVTAEDNVAVPPTADVMWQDTGRVQSAIPQPTLRKQFATLPTYMLLRDLRWLQLTTYPSQDDGDGEARSPAAGGLLIGQFLLGAYGADDPDVDYAYGILTTNNGEATFLFTEGPQVLADVETSPVAPPGVLVTERQPRRNS